MTNKEEMIKGLTDELKHLELMVEKTIKKELQKIDSHYKELGRKLMEERDAVKKQYCDAAKRNRQFIAKRDEVNSFIAEIHDAESTNSNQMQQKYNKLTKCTELAAVEFIPIEKPLPALGKVLSSAPPSPTESEIVCGDLSHFTLGKTNEVTINLKDSDRYFCKGGIDISAKLKSCINEEKSVKISDNGDGSCVVSFASTQAGKATLSVLKGGQEFLKQFIIVSTNDYKNFCSSDCLLSTYGKLIDVAFSRCGKRSAIADEDNHCVYVSNKLKINLKPTGIAFDGNNDLYVMASSASDGGYIHRFNATSGKLLDIFGKCGAGDGQLGHPPGGIAAHNGKVYVADCTNSRIVVFWKDGQCWHYETIGDLYKPCDVAINLKENMLHVIDSYKRVVTFSLGGGPIVRQFRTRKPNSVEVYPQRLAIDADGLILVKSHRGVLVFDCVGNYISCFDFECNVYGIAVNPTGQIHTSGDSSMQIWELAM